MSLLPLLFDEPVVCHSPGASLLGQLLTPSTRYYQDWPAAQALNELRSQLSQIEKDTSISVDKDHFQANIDVQQFKPEEIKVKITGDREISVEGKHEEKQDEHGYVSRHFVRRYVLPEDCDIRRVQSKLSSDGVLSISAPKVEQGNKLEHKEIPITRTGQPVKKIEQKKDEQKKEKPKK